jgi:hypothetical protein
MAAMRRMSHVTTNARSNFNPYRVLKSRAVPEEGYLGTRDAGRGGADCAKRTRSLYVCAGREYDAI